MIVPSTVRPTAHPNFHGNRGIDGGACSAAAIRRAICTGSVPDSRRRADETASFCARAADTGIGATCAPPLAAAAAGFTGGTGPPALGVGVGDGPAGGGVGAGPSGIGLPAGAPAPGPTPTGAGPAPGIPAACAVVPAGAAGPGGAPVPAPGAGALRGCVVGAAPSGCDGDDGDCGAPPPFAASVIPFWNCSNGFGGLAPAAAGFAGVPGALADDAASGLGPPIDIGDPDDAPCVPPPVDPDIAGAPLRLDVDPPDTGACESGLVCPDEGESPV